MATKVQADTATDEADQDEKETILFLARYLLVDFFADFSERKPR